MNRVPTSAGQLLGEGKEFGAENNEEEAPVIAIERLWNLLHSNLRLNLQYDLLKYLYGQRSVFPSMPSQLGTKHPPAFVTQTI